MTDSRELVGIRGGVAVELTRHRDDLALWPWSWRVFRDGFRPITAEVYDHPDRYRFPSGVAWTRWGAIRQARRAVV